MRFVPASRAALKVNDFSKSDVQGTIFPADPRLSIGVHINLDK